MSISHKTHSVVQELQDLIIENNWEVNFNQAISNAHNTKINTFSQLTNLTKYLEWINTFLYWIPEENSKGTCIYDYLGAFYYIFNYKSLLNLQNEVIPQDKAPKLTKLSEWLVKYTNEIGIFMDTFESLSFESEKTFYNSPIYNMNEYIRPNGGWKTFNQLFARNFKPGFIPSCVLI